MNIANLMPQFLAVRHDGYLLRHIDQGKQTILLTNRFTFGIK